MECKDHSSYYILATIADVTGQDAPILNLETSANSSYDVFATTDASLF